MRESRPATVIRPPREPQPVGKREPSKAEAPPADREVIFKLCVLGDASCGKAALLRPLVYSMFDQKYITTIGTKVTKKSVVYERPRPQGIARIRATLVIWNILSQKQYSKLHPVYFQGSNGALIVSSAAASDPFESFRAWARAFSEVAGPLPLLFLLNRGSDSAKVAPSEADHLGAEFPRTSFMIVSPEDPSTMEQALHDIGGRILDERVALRSELLSSDPAEKKRPRRGLWRPRAKPR